MPRLNADLLDGKDIGALDAEQVKTGNGPLPREGTYTSKGGALVISASGSGFRSVAFARQGGDIGMNAHVGGGFEGI